MRKRVGLVVVGAALAFLAVRRRRPQFRPFALLLSRTSGLPPEQRAKAQKRVFKALYDTITLLLRPDGGFLNYGYAPIDAGAEPLELPPDREPDRYAMQLYEKVAAAVPLRGLDVLEVGCGRGGGTAYLFERHEPRSMTGLDLSSRAIAHCRRRYGRAGLQFVAGDAENLPLADASFDVVVNVESSHCYPDAARFFAEVARVLRPGGVLVFADLRHSSPDERDGPNVGNVSQLRAQIAAAGMVVVEEEDISANVRRSMELDSPRRRAEIEAKTPRFMREQVLDFAGVEGSGLHRSLTSGSVTYLRMVLRPARDAEEPVAA